ncbi:hypothetical protein C9374_011384 [Naegleria lovaniensis]|uniref:Uncharacterized protein n=1 Tax=Naegleria lovaniensis TaxID=51637 RepID=A0AA88H2X1_NAELO|nr:uncharacterized protein C9374_011384 [Naegleria lovaniensis]KAG2392659.1 hypothetical protein C9374_011384 [Naegleria lovaniensis]
MEIQPLVEDQSVTSSCCGRFFENNFVYAVESKGNKLHFFRFVPDEDTFENVMITFDGVKRIMKLVVIELENIAVNYLLVIDNDLMWYLVKIENREGISILHEGSLSLASYISDKVDAREFEKKIEEATRTVFPISCSRKKQNYSEVILSIYNQYVYYFKFEASNAFPTLVENKIFEIRPQSSFSSKALFKIVDLSFLKSYLSEETIEIVGLLQEFVGEHDDSNYSLPAVPHTFLGTFVLELTCSLGKTASSRVFSAEAFLKAANGPFSVYNIHPTTTCLFSDNYGVLIMSSYGFSYYCRNGLLTDCQVDMANVNSLVCPCHVVLLEEQRKKCGACTFELSKTLCCLYSDGSVVVLFLTLEHSIAADVKKAKITNKKAVIPKQQVGELLAFHCGQNNYKIFISSPYENTQTKWIELSILKHNDITAHVRNYYDSIGSNIDEEQLPCLGTITHSHFHNFKGSRDSRLACTSFSGSHNQYCQYVRGAARFSVCQMGSRLIPFMPITQGSIIEGSPEIIVLPLKDHSILCFSYDNCTTFFSTKDMSPISFNAMNGAKKLLALKEFKRNPVSLFFVAIWEDEIALCEIQFNTQNVHVLFKRHNDGEKYLFAEIEPNGRIFVSRRNEITTFEIKSKPLSVVEVSTNSLENQISTISSFNHEGKTYLIVAFWIVNSVYIIDVDSWSIIMEKKYHETIRSCLAISNSIMSCIVLGFSDGSCIVDPIFLSQLEEHRFKVGESSVKLRRVTTENSEDVIYCMSNRDLMIVQDREQIAIDGRRVLKTVFFTECNQKRYAGRSIDISNVVTSQFGNCVALLMEQPEGGAIQFCEVSADKKLRWRSMNLEKQMQESNSIIEPLKSIYLERSSKYVVVGLERSLVDESLNALLFQCVLDDDTESQFYQDKVIEIGKYMPEKWVVSEKDISTTSHSILDVCATRIDGEEYILLVCLTTFSHSCTVEEDTGAVALSVAWICLLSSNMTKLKSTIIGEHPVPFHDESTFAKIHSLDDDGRFCLLYNNMIHLVKLEKNGEKMKFKFVDRYELLDYAKESSLTYPVYSKYFNRASPIFRSLHFVMNTVDIVMDGSDVYLTLCSLNSGIRLLRFGTDCRKMEELLLMDRTNTNMLPLSCVFIPSRTHNQQHKIVISDYVDGDLKVLSLTQQERRGQRKLASEYKIKEEDKTICSHWNQFENNHLYYYIDLLNKEVKGIHLDLEKTRLHPSNASVDNHRLVEAEKGTQYELLVQSCCKSFSGSVKNIVRGQFDQHLNLSLHDGDSKSTLQQDHFLYVTTEGEIGRLYTQSTPME